MDSLQRNQIYLGDAYELIKMVPDKSVDLIVTDPPYLYTTAKKEAVTLTRAEALAKAETMSDCRAEIGKIANRLQIQSISGGFDFSLLDTLDAKMKGINIYLWCSVHQLYPLLGHYLGKGCMIDVLTWHKTNCSPLANGTYLNDTEYCVYAHDHGIAVGGDRKSKVKWYVTCMNQFDKRLYDHPTIKPLNIIENLVRNSSSRGGLILDPFLGSGTTAVAAKELGRDYMGFEIEPRYYAIAKDRLAGVDQRGQTSLDLGWEQGDLLGDDKGKD